MAGLLCAAALAGASQKERFGAVEGDVKFPGETPPPGMIVNPYESACPKGIPETHLLVRQADRGLRNVLVVLASPAEPILGVPVLRLKNRGCAFSPRMQWAPVGASLLMEKEGPAHRVRATLKDVIVFEVDVDDSQPSVRRPLVRRGLLKLSCEWHLWEKAWIYVSDHPFAAVTDEAGHFRIERVPPGRHRLVAWHEGWTEEKKDKDGRPELLPWVQTGELTVRAGQTASITLRDLLPEVIPTW